MARRVRLARALHVPEAEVDVPATAHRVEGEPVNAQADRADPLRPQTDFLGVESEELGGARNRDVDVLDHRLRMQAEHALELLRHADAAVPAHDLRIGFRAQSGAPINAPHQWILSKYILRAPEPVGVPAPQVVVDLD